MVQGSDSLEVNLDTYLDDSASTSCDVSNLDAHALNEKLSQVCDNLLSTQKALKNKNFELKEKK